VARRPPSDPAEAVLLPRAGAAGALAYTMGNTGWQMAIDPSSNRPYYFNPQTNEVTWTPPAGMSPGAQQYFPGMNPFSMAQAYGMFQQYGQDTRHQ